MHFTYQVLLDYWQYRTKHSAEFCSCLEIFLFCYLGFLCILWTIDCKVFFASEYKVLKTSQHYDRQMERRTDERTDTRTHNSITLSLTPRTTMRHTPLIYKFIWHKHRQMNKEVPRDVRQN